MRASMQESRQSGIDFLPLVLGLVPIERMRFFDTYRYGADFMSTKTQDNTSTNNSALVLFKETFPK